MEGYFRTREKLLTRRGVLWLGQTCNLRCHFCYYLDRIEDRDHPEHAFMELEKAKEICHDLRYRYGNTSIDLQGGEPTIWRHIDELVAYCREIGLYPTLITNAIVLARLERCERLKASGVRDLKISVQGLREVYDEVVGQQGGSVKQAQALQNCVELGIPTRFNCALTTAVLPQLVEIAELAISTRALAVSFLALNPFQDQSTGKRSTENVPRYTDVGAALDEVLDVLEDANVEANVRYLPLCMVDERHRKSMYNMQQMSYDPQEWDYDSWYWTDQLPQRMRSGDTSEHHAGLEAMTYGSPVFVRGVATAAGVTTRVASAVGRWLRPFPRLKAAARTAYRAAIQRVHRIRPSLRRAREHGADYLVHDELGRDPQVYRDIAIVKAVDHTGYQYPPQCAECDVKSICDGFHSDYASLFGAAEARPIRIGKKVTDPLYFIREQLKVYEPEETARPFTHREPFAVPRLR